MAEKRRPGRPTTYNPELVEVFLEKLESGLCLSEIAAIDGMPKVSTVYQWKARHPEFAEAYARACDAGVLENEAELMREARRKPVDSVDAAAQRVLVDTLKWRLSKRLPKEFGDKLEHSGEIKTSPMTPDERAARLAAILLDAGRRKGGSGATEQSGTVADGTD